MVRKLTIISSVFSLLLFTHCGFLGSGKVKNAGTPATQSGGGDNGGGGTDSTRLSGGTPRFTITFSVPVTKNTCWPASVNYFEGEKAAPIPAATRVRLSGSIGIAFHSQATCLAGNQVTEIDFSAGSSSVPFYFKASNEGFQSVTVTPISGTMAQVGQTSFTVQAGPNSTVPTNLRLLGPTQADAGTCVSYSASLYDTNGSPTSFTSQTTLGLSSLNPVGKFYSAGCASEMNSVNVPAGNVSTTVYFKTNVTGNFTLEAHQASLSSSLSLAVGAGQPHHLSLTGPITVHVTSCASYRLTIKDALENNSHFTVAKSVTVDPGAIGEFYNEPACSSAKVTSISFPSGVDTKDIYFKAALLGNTTLNASLSGLSPASLALTLTDPTPDAPNRLSIQLPPAGSQTIAGTCFGPFKVVQVNRAGTILNNAHIRSVNLSDTGGGLAYSNDTCSAAISSIMTENNFYFRDTIAETTVLSAIDASTSPIGSDTKSLQISAASASMINFSALPSSFLAGGNSAVTVRLTDSFGNVANAGSPLNIVLSQTGLPQGSFLQSGCGANLPVVSGNANLSFAANENQKVFCYTATKSGDAYITGSAPLFTPQNLTLNVVAGAPTKVKFISGPGTINLSQCGGAYRFDLFDMYDNPAVAGSSGVTINLTKNLGNFHATNTCTTASVSSMSFPSGSGTQNIYFTSPSAGTLNGTASGTGISSASFTVTVADLNANKLVLEGVSPINTSSPGESIVGLCLGFDLKAKSASNMDAPVTSDSSVALNASGVSYGARFFSDSTCNTQTTGVVITANTSSKRLYFKGQTAGIAFVNATSSSLSGAQYQISLSAGPAAAIIVSGPYQANSQACAGPFHVSFYDVYNNPTAAPGLTVNLSGQGTGDFYRENTCATVARSQTTVSPYIGLDFYFKDPAHGMKDLVISTSPNAGTVHASLDIKALVKITPPISPAIGLVKGEDTITINGQFLKPAVNVNPVVTIGSFGNCTIVTATNTQITCRTPAGTVGRYGVTVTNGLGTFTLPDAYTYADCKAASAIVGGPVSPGIDGYDFTRYTQIRGMGIVSTSKMPVACNPYYKNCSGLTYHNNAATGKMLCRMNGYANVNNVTSGSWSSPHDNAGMVWNPTAKEFTSPIPRASTIANNWIRWLYCKDKLLQVCYDKPSWIFE